MAIKNVGVFSGSRKGSDPRFHEDSARLGRLLAEKGWNMVYGGGRMGLMGSVSEAFMENGGYTIGIVPEIFASLGDKKLVSEVVNVRDMAERKVTMERMSDAFVILPGGMGTIDEWSEMVVGRQIGTNRKQCIVLNTAGYWDDMRSMVEKMFRVGFANERDRNCFVFVDTPEDAIKELEKL